MVIKMLYISSITGGAQASYFYLKPPITSRCGRFSPWGMQFLFESDILVQNYRSAFCSFKVLIQTHT